MMVMGVSGALTCHKIEGVDARNRRKNGVRGYPHVSAIGRDHCADTQLCPLWQPRDHGCITHNATTAEELLVLPCLKLSALSVNQLLFE